MDTLNEQTNDQPKRAGKSTAQLLRRRKAIVAIHQNSTMEKAAAAIGVHVSTLYRFMKDPEFRKELLEAGGEMSSHTTARLQDTSGPAVSLLRQIIHDPKAPPNSRLRAADLVLKHATSRSELEDLQVRVRDLEKRAA
jgi:hypothetical protein